MHCLHGRRIAAKCAVVKRNSKSGVRDQGSELAAPFADTRSLTPGSAALLRAERLAEDHECDQISHSAALRFEVAEDLVDVRPIRGVGLPAHGVGQQLNRQRPGELLILLDQDGLQAGDVFERPAVGELTGGVDLSLPRGSSRASRRSDRSSPGRSRGGRSCDGIRCNWQCRGAWRVGPGWSSRRERPGRAVPRPVAAETEAFPGCSPATRRRGQRAMCRCHWR